MCLAVSCSAYSADDRYQSALQNICCLHAQPVLHCTDHPHLALFSCHAAGFQPSVRDFDQLKALARRSGGDAAALNRGACKICGGLGHLTKQCRNFLDKGNGAAAGGEAAAAAGGGERQLLTHEDEEALLLNSDSMDSSDLGSDSDSDSDRERVSGTGQQQLLAAS